MASADLETPTLAFLVGDSGDIRTGVNAEQANLLAAGSVYAARAPQGKEGARKANALPLVIEVTRVTSAPDRQVGPGWVERDVTYDLRIVLRRKDVTAGAAQAVTLKQVCRALVARYHGFTNLGITVTVPSGTTATFVRSAASVKSIDESSEAETARAIVRAVFTFQEPQGVNT
jgi:hypothetical protein